MKRLFILFVLFSCTKSNEVQSNRVDPTGPEHKIEGPVSEKEMTEEGSLSNAKNSKDTQVPAEPKVNSPVVTVPALDPNSLPSLEQFKKNHPEVRVKIEKLNEGQMNPGATQSLEEFKKMNPDVKIQINKLEDKQMIPVKKP